MTVIDKWGNIEQPVQDSRWPKLVLSSRHDRRWLELRSSLLWQHPAFADIFLSMMVDKDKTYGWFTDQTPIAATDGKIAYFNPNTFFENYTLDEQIFIVCHEICHGMFNHCGLGYDAKMRGYIIYPDGVKLSYNDEIMGKATDCLINDMLIESNIGKMPKDGWHMPQLITYKDDMFTAFRKLYQKEGGSGNPNQKNRNGKNNQRDNEGDNPNSGSKRGHGSFDQHLDPGTGRGKSPQQSKEERNEQAWDNAIDAAMQNAKKQGRLPAALERGMSKLLEPKVDWKEHLYFEIAKKIGNDRSTWELLDNELMLRGIGAPGKHGYCCDLVVFVCDSSGSIYQTTADMFHGECGGIMEELRPKQIIYMQCDAKVYDYTEIEYIEDLVRPLKGGGGTSFIPPFERIAAEGLEPDCVVYLTDLEGRFPTEQPPYPVIWATIKDHPVPWGNKVLIPQQAKYSGSN